MQEIKIKVYSKLNDVVENNEYLAVIDSKLIKYIDLENNKMTVDMDNNLIIRENSDYFFNIDFNNNKITITMKKMNKIFEKEIKTLVITSTSKSYLVRYLLTDENIVNEYYVKL